MEFATIPLVLGTVKFQVDVIEKESIRKSRKQAKKWQRWAVWRKKDNKLTRGKKSLQLYREKLGMDRSRSNSPLDFYPGMAEIRYSEVYPLYVPNWTIIVVPVDTDLPGVTD